MEWIGAGKRMRNGGKAGERRQTREERGQSGYPRAEAETFSAAGTSCRGNCGIYHDGLAPSPKMWNAPTPEFVCFFAMGKSFPCLKTTFFLRVLPNSSLQSAQLPSTWATHHVSRKTTISAGHKTLAGESLAQRQLCAARMGPLSAGKQGTGLVLAGERQPWVCCKRAGLLSGFPPWWSSSELQFHLSLTDCQR